MCIRDRNTSNYAVDLVNRAVLAAGGPENIVVSVKTPTMDSSKEMVSSPAVKTVSYTHLAKSMS